MSDSSTIPEGKKIYFASDFHLGSFPLEDSASRERKIVAWLDHIKQDASELYLLGDVFDFWFEYGSVIPKGNIRFLGKLAELSDLGIQIFFFKGNHDMWMFDYFVKELNAQIIADELVITRNSKQFYLHHGDGVGPGDGSYKLLKKVFRSPLCQWLFARLHPNLGIGVARRWSKQSRIASGKEERFEGEESEWLVIYAKQLLKKKYYDYFVFGHRHLPLDIPLNASSRYINLGEWMNYCTYGVFDGENFSLESWTDQ